MLGLAILPTQSWQGPVPATLAGEHRGEPHPGPSTNGLSGAAWAHGASEDEPKAHVCVPTTCTVHTCITGLVLHALGHA